MRLQELKIEEKLVILTSCIWFYSVYSQVNSQIMDVYVQGNEIKASYLLIILLRHQLLFLVCVRFRE